MLDLEFVEPLSKEEQLELLNKYSNTKDLNLRNKLVEHNLKLIVSRLHKKFYGYKDMFEDLFQLGVLSLIKAVETFDITKDIQFSTYASKCIDNEILCYVLSLHSNEKSLNDKINNDTDNDIELIDTLRDERDYEKDVMDKTHLMRMLSKLDNKSRDIVISYYGVFNEEKLNQRQLAEKYNVSYCRIQQILLKSLFRMKNLDLNYSKVRGSIFDVFSGYDKDTILKAINLLSYEDKELLKEIDINSLNVVGKEKELYLKIRKNL